MAARGHSTARPIAFPASGPPSGRIRRSSHARHSFQQVHPCPSTGSTAGHCPGYMVDHIVPLKRGGADSPENMQWQTAAEAKAKDRVE
jgi:5-methylcytosine-specific restriction endonuclease McrA